MNLELAHSDNQQNGLLLDRQALHRLTARSQFVDTATARMPDRALVETEFGDLRVKNGPGLMAILVLPGNPLTKVPQNIDRLPVVGGDPRRESRQIGGRAFELGIRVLAATDTEEFRHGFDFEHVNDTTGSNLLKL
ncbi:MAG: hypothetical protein JJ899_07370 [Alphaproteobacteria bacterium]|nr:hypothetical protein [Alphaproteobacteria bacterium]